MLVKIGDLVFSSADQPIMVVLNQQDLKAIFKSGEIKGIGVKHVSAPGSCKQKEIKKLMSADGAKRVMITSVGAESKTGKYLIANLRCMPEVS